MHSSYAEFLKYLDENPSILDQIKAALNIQTDSDLAEFLNISNSAVTKARKTRAPEKWILYTLYVNPIALPTFLFSSENLLRKLFYDQVVPIRIISNIYFDTDRFVELEEGLVYSTLNRVFNRPNHLKNVDLVYYYIQSDMMAPTVQINDNVIINKNFREDLITNKIMIMYVHQQMVIGRPRFDKGRAVIRFDNPNLDPIEADCEEIKFYGMLVQLQRKMDI
jgi:hypothetical protein